MNNGSAEELAFYKPIPPANIVRDANDNRKYTLTTTLTPGTYSSILLLANSASVLENQSSLLATGTPRQDIQQGLIRQVADGEKWKTGTTDAEPIPMCGEVTGGSAGITIKPGEVPFSNVTLHSMLVRINLQNNEDEEIFKPQEVYLYHMRRNGLIIPGQTGAWGGGGGGGGGGG
ncbi:MAG: hypothetical protein LUG98_10570, partial [Tannerellaceae bacterium]|nr:hypothetical protein [Tannerellaceae bacterium]